MLLLPYHWDFLILSSYSFVTLSVYYHHPFVSCFSLFVLPILFLSFSFTQEAFTKPIKDKISTNSFNIEVSFETLLLVLLALKPLYFLFWFLKSCLHFLRSLEETNIFQKLSSFSKGKK